MFRNLALELERIEVGLGAHLRPAMRRLEHTWDGGNEVPATLGLTTMLDPRRPLEAPG